MTPDFKIVVDDRDVTARIRGGLDSLRLTDKKGMESDEFELKFTAFDPGFALPRTGVMVQIAIGWKGRGLVDKGTYKVDGVTEDGPPDMVTIKGRAADLTTAMTEHRDGSWDGKTLGEIITDLAQRQGLEPVIGDDIAAIKINHLDQTGESDANLMTRLGQQYGLISTVKDGKMIFTERGGTTASGAKIGTAVVRRSDGDKHSFEMTMRDKEVGQVSAKWRDTGKAKTETVKIGAKTEGKGGRTLRGTYASKAEAEAAAKAELAKNGREGVKLSLALALGREDIIAGQPLLAEGYRPEISNQEWEVEEVTHTLNEQGFVTQIQACPMGESE